MSGPPGDPWQLPAKEAPTDRLPNTLREQLFHIIHAASFQAASYSADAAAAVLAAGWRPPSHIVWTVAHLEVLPPLSVVVTEDGKAWQAGTLDGYDAETDLLTYDRIWHPAGMDVWSTSTSPSMLPARVVWEP